MSTARISSGPVLYCFGVWFSAARGVLTDAALALLNSTADPYLWTTFRNVVDSYAARAAGETVDPDESAFVQSVLDVHAWPAAADVLRRQLARDPYYLRRLMNQDRWAPGPDSQQSPLAGFWLCPWEEELPPPHRSSTPSVPSIPQPAHSKHPFNATGLLSPNLSGFEIRSTALHDDRGRT